MDENHHEHEHFFLFVDEFDPHEPFHSSEPYNSMYDPDWNDDLFFWPTYGPNLYSDDELKHLKAQYAGKLTIADTWLGRVLNRMDQYRLWENTLIILTTDHGHFLGEHEWVGKGIYPQYQTIAHIPLVIHDPTDDRPRRSQALTTVVDIAATVLDVYDIDRGHMDGRSILPLLRGEREQIREYALYGWFGAYMQITDGTYTYLKAPESLDNGPLYIYRMTWNSAPWWNIPVPDRRLETDYYIPHEDRAIGRILLNKEEKYELGIQKSQIAEPTQLFNVLEDPDQTRDLSGDGRLVNRYDDFLIRALREVGCPPEQFQRLALRL